jgi:hypothetical protein
MWFLPSLYRIMKCQSVSGNSPARQLQEGHEAPVNQRYHVSQPGLLPSTKRLKSVREVKIQKGVSVKAWGKGVLTYSEIRRRGHGAVVGELN